MARAYVFWIAVATTTWTPASALTCRPSAGGVSFVADAVREAPVAAVRVAGSEKCDVVYHLRNGAYSLGGCNREYVGLWAPREGAPIGKRHGQIPLECQ